MSCLQLITWRSYEKHAPKYKFGNQGKILLLDTNFIERTKINVLLSPRTCCYFPTITPSDVFSINKESTQDDLHEQLRILNCIQRICFNYMQLYYYASDKVNNFKSIENIEKKRISKKRCLERRSKSAMTDRGYIIIRQINFKFFNFIPFKQLERLARLFWQKTTRRWPEPRGFDRNKCFTSTAQRREHPSLSQILTLEGRLVKINGGTRNVLSRGFRKKRRRAICVLK